MTNYWNFLNTVSRGRVPRLEHCLAPDVPPGTVLQAVDRKYQVQKTGTWVRVRKQAKLKADELRLDDVRLPASKSNIYFPVLPAKNKYPRAAK